jgi:site-specific recombinase XerD
MAWKKYPSIFEEKGKYYFKIQRNGKRRTIPALGKSKQERMDYMRSYCDALDNGSGDLTTLKDIMMLFSKEDTNPNYLVAKATGGKYTRRWAHTIATYTNQSLDVMAELNPKLAKRPAGLIRKQDLLNYQLQVVAKFGQISHVNKMMLPITMSLNYAERMEIIDHSPAHFIKQVKSTEPTEVGKRMRGAICPEDIRVLLNGDFYRNELEKNIFALYACTGMRLAEVACLNTEQWDKVNHYLMVDRAFKDDNFMEVGLPKCDVRRVIPLGNLATKAITYLYERADPVTGNFFRNPKRWQFENIPNFVKAVAMTKPERFVDPSMVERMTLHYLRHSLNSNLRKFSGLPALLVAEYMSWNHQSQLQVQEGYTHIYGRDLIPVAEEIDKLYTQKIVQFAGTVGAVTN